MNKTIEQRILATLARIDKALAPVVRVHSTIKHQGLMLEPAKTGEQELKPGRVWHTKTTGAKSKGRTFLYDTTGPKWRKVLDSNGRWIEKKG